MLAALVNQFGASDERARALIQLYNRASAASFLGLVYDKKSDTAYFYLRHLGTGTFGYVVSASTDGGSRPQAVVKQIKLREPFYIELVEREYKIGVLIRHRLSAMFCNNYAVCAQERFYDQENTTGFIVFPYNTTRSLRDYLMMYLHPQMLAARPEQRARLQFVAADLVLQLLYTLATLHLSQVFHCDVKPANAIVDHGDEDEPTHKLRLIDFGFACAFGSDDANVACPVEYRTSPLYRDPLALEERVADVPVQKRYAKFDTYAAAKTMQVVFDPNTDLVLGYPVVRRTEFMMPGLSDLITRMTGERDYAPLHTQRPELSTAELRERRRAFDARPTMSEAFATLAALVRQFAASVENK